MNRIRKLRMNKGLNVSEVAKAIGINPSFLGRIEKGERNFTLETAKKIAEFYHVTTDYILGVSQLPYGYTFQISTIEKNGKEEEQKQLEHEINTKLQSDLLIYCTSKKHYELCELVNELSQNDLFIIEASVKALLNTKKQYSYYPINKNTAE